LTRWRNGLWRARGDQQSTAGQDCCPKKITSAQTCRETFPRLASAFHGAQRQTADERALDESEEQGSGTAGQGSVVPGAARRPAQPLLV